MLTARVLQACDAMDFDKTEELERRLLEFSCGTADLGIVHSDVGKLIAISSIKAIAQLKQKQNRLADADNLYRAARELQLELLSHRTSQLCTRSIW